MTTSNYVVHLLPNDKFAVVKSDVRLTAKNVTSIDSSMIFDDSEAAQITSMIENDIDAKIERELVELRKLFDFAD